MLKKIVFAFALLIFSLSLSSKALAADASFSISGGGDHQIGSNFDITVNLNPNGNGVAAVEFSMTYPANLLELVDSKKGSRWTLAGDFPDESAGLVHKMIGSTTNITDNVAVYTFTFKPKSAGSGQISFSNTAVTNLNTDTMNSTNSGASFNITALATNTGTSTTTNTGTAAPSTSNTSTSKKSTTTQKTTPTATTTTPTTTPAATTPAATLTTPALSKIAYSSSALLDDQSKKAKGITLSGTADPLSKIFLIIESDPISVSTVSDDKGAWSYTLDQWLGEGVHKVTLHSEKDTLKSTEGTSNFVFNTDDKNLIALGTSLPQNDQSIAEPAAETQTSNSKNLIMIYGAIGLGIVAIVGVYFFIISRRRHVEEAAFATTNPANTYQESITPNPLAPSTDNIEVASVGQQTSQIETPMSQPAPETPVTNHAPNIDAVLETIVAPTPDKAPSIEHGFDHSDAVQAPAPTTPAPAPAPQDNITPTPNNTPDQK